MNGPSGPLSFLERDKMKFCWLSDIHLNFLEESAQVAFLERVRDHESDFVILTGDITEAPGLEHALRLIDQTVGKPVYFVLGNHDFWGTSTAYIEEKMPSFVSGMTYLKWMSSFTGAVPLDSSVGIVGHDGWYDCLNGNWRTSRFQMVDWRRVADYKGVQKMQDVAERSLALAVKSANHVKKQLQDAVSRFQTVIVLTHVPPYPETHVFEGRIGDDYAQPFFTSKVMGDLLLAAAKGHPDKRFVVFAGHTHGRVSRQILPNLTVHVAGADYGKPEIQDVTSL